MVKNVSCDYDPIYNNLQAPFTLISVRVSLFHFFFLARFALTIMLVVSCDETSSKTIRRDVDANVNANGKCACSGAMDCVNWGYWGVSTISFYLSVRQHENRWIAQTLSTVSAIRTGLLYYWNGTYIWVRIAYICSLIVHIYAATSSMLKWKYRGIRETRWRLCRHWKIYHWGKLLYVCKETSNCCRAAVAHISEK